MYHMAGYSTATYGGIGHMVNSSPRFGNSTIFLPSASDHGSSSGLSQDLCRRNTNLSYDHRLFDGMSQSGFCQKYCSYDQATNQNTCSQVWNINASGHQPERWHGNTENYGHQVFSEMPSARDGYGQFQGGSSKSRGAAQNPYHSNRSTAHVGSQIGLQPGEVGSNACKCFEVMSALHGRVLSLRLHHKTSPVTMEELHKVFSHFGVAEKIIYTVHIHTPNLLVQYQSCQIAMQAAGTLQGKYIPEVHCQLEVHFAQWNELQTLQDYATALNSQSSLSDCDDKHGRAEQQGNKCSEKRKVEQVLNHVTTINDVQDATSKQQEFEEKKGNSTTHGYSWEQVTERIADYLEKSKRRELEEKQRRVQEELNKELDHLLYQAFDLFEEMAQFEVDTKLKKEGTNPVVAFNLSFDGVFSFLDEKRISYSAMPKKCTSIGQQLLTDLEGNANFINKHILAAKLRNKELKYAAMISLPQDMTCVDKIQVCYPDVSNFARHFSKVPGQNLIDSASEFFLLYVPDLSIRQDLNNFSNEESRKSPWEHREVSFDFKLYKKNVKSQHMEVTQKKLMLSDADKVFEFGHSQPATFFFLLHYGIKTEIFPWDPGNKGGKKVNLLGLLQFNSNDAVLSLPWDPGDANLIEMTKSLGLEVHWQFLRLEEFEGSVEHTRTYMQMFLRDAIYVVTSLPSYLYCTTSQSTIGVLKIAAECYYCLQLAKRTCYPSLLAKPSDNFTCAGFIIQPAKGASQYIYSLLLMNCNCQVLDILRPRTQEAAVCSIMGLYIFAGMWSHGVLNIYIQATELDVEE